MREVVIVEAVRTPIGRRNGALKDVHPVVLAAMALRELMQRAKIDPALVEECGDGLRQPGRRAESQHRAQRRPAGGFPHRRTRR